MLSIITSSAGEIIIGGAGKSVAASASEPPDRCGKRFFFLVVVEHFKGWFALRVRLVFTPLGGFALGTDVSV